MTKRKPGSTTPPKVFWTDDQVAVLRARYPHEKTAQLAEHFGFSVGRVYSKAAKLGLNKSEAFLSTPDSGRTDGKRIGMTSRFLPGHESWNKGTKGVSGQHPNCRRAQFKKGRAAFEARNYVPIGTEKISRDGYLVRKFTDDPSLLPVRRWEAVHRLVWIEANGPIPEGYVVCFLPGRFSIEVDKITLDALELVSRGDLANRNHPRSKDPELAKLVQLKGAITRQVNRIAREAKENES